jgi:hypothetical protein
MHGRVAPASNRAGTPSGDAARLTPRGLLNRLTV